MFKIILIRIPILMSFCTQKYEIEDIDYFSNWGKRKELGYAPLL